MYNPYSLENKTVLVTGASSGIGRCVAVECSKLGACVIITGRNCERLNETFEMLEGGGHQQIVADLTRYEDIERLVDACPKLQGVSHNVGITRVLLLKFVQLSYLDEILQTNTVAPILLTQLLVKKKKMEKASSIVFTSAVSGNSCVHFGETMFAASKAAISGFSKAAALDLSAQQIRVNCINPSVIKTDRLMANNVLSAEELKEKENYFPLKRFGNPVDVALAIVFFLSDASSWITGESMQVDGGYTLL